MLHLLYLFGLDPASEEARRAIAPVHEAARWDYDQNLRFLQGEVEPCINGRVVAIGAYFGQDVRGIVDRLLTEQMADGGWNCEQERGSTRGSFDSTLNVLEGPARVRALDRGERATLPRPASAARNTCSSGGCSAGCPMARSGRSAGSTSASRTRGSTTSSRALDYFRVARPEPDERMTEALEIVESKRDADGRWPLDHAYHEELLVDFGEREGQPSRWITLRALRILRWAGESVPATATSGTVA